MKFVRITGFAIRPGKAEAFQEWLKANEEQVARSYPEGIRYLGTYFAPYTSEKNMGDLFTLEELDSYGALDNLSAPGSQYNSAWEPAVSQFFDQSPHADWSSMLMKNYTGATIIEAVPD